MHLNGKTWKITFLLERDVDIWSEKESHDIKSDLKSGKRTSALLMVSTLLMQNIVYQIDFKRLLVLVIYVTSKLC